MTFISKEEYLKLIQAAQNEEDMEEYSVPEAAWIPATPPAKARMELAKAAISNGVIDVLNYKKERLHDILYKKTNLQVGEFTIRIEEYHGRPNKDAAVQLTMDILVWQERYQTPSGSPCKMSYKMDFFRDNRFSNCPWLSYFNSGGRAHDIPADTVVSIIKHMQMIQRLTAFL